MLFVQSEDMPPYLAPFVYDARYRRLELRSAILLYVAVLVLGSIPGARADIGELASGLVLHTLTYCVIALLLFGGVAGSPWQKAVKTFFTIVAMGALDEYVQSFFPYRTSSVFDWLVDINAGFVTSAVLWFLWPKESDPYSRQRP